MASLKQENVTRNQADLILDRSCPLFIFDNTFDRTNVKVSANTDIKQGNLVVRNADGTVGIAKADNLDAVIGISAETFTVTAASNPILTYGTSGTVRQNNLLLPDTVTLKTMVGKVTLKDYLNGLGFNLVFSTPNL